MYSFKQLIRKVINHARLLRACDRFLNLKRGTNFQVGSNCLIYPTRFITVKNNSSFGRNVIISTSESGQSPISIGNDVMLAQHVMLIGGNHSFTRTDIPISCQGEGKQGPIIIEDDVWIGARSIVLTGVTIGKGSIVGAGSVVTRNIPPYSIAAGNPARIINKRY